MFSRYMMGKLACAQTLAFVETRPNQSLIMPWTYTVRNGYERLVLEVTRYPGKPCVLGYSGKSRLFIRIQFDESSIFPWVLFLRTARITQHTTLCTTVLGICNKIRLVSYTSAGRFFVSFNLQVLPLVRPHPLLLPLHDCHQVGI